MHTTKAIFLFFILYVSFVATLWDQWTSKESRSWTSFYELKEGFVLDSSSTSTASAHSSSLSNKSKTSSSSTTPSSTTSSSATSSSTVSSFTTSSPTTSSATSSTSYPLLIRDPPDGGHVDLAARGAASTFSLVTTSYTTTTTTTSTITTTTFTITSTITTTSSSSSTSTSPPACQTPISSTTCVEYYCCDGCPDGQAVGCDPLNFNCAVYAGSCGCPVPPCQSGTDGPP